MLQIETRGHHPVLRIAKIGEARLVESQGDRRAQGARLSKGVVVAQVESVKLGAEYDLGGAPLLVLHQIVGAESKGGQTIARAQVVSNTRLVVPIIDLGVFGQERQDE